MPICLRLFAAAEEPRGAKPESGRAATSAPTPSSMFTVAAATAALPSARTFAPLRVFAIHSSSGAGKPVPT